MPPDRVWASHGGHEAAVSISSGQSPRRAYKDRLQAWRAVIEVADEDRGHEDPRSGVRCAGHRRPVENPQTGVSSEPPSCVARLGGFECCAIYSRRHESPHVESDLLVTY